MTDANWDVSAESWGVAVRLGVLGGTFDPIHIGHLVIAEEARVELELERVVFIPAGLPPHKPDYIVSSVEHRLAMVELAIASNLHFAVSRVDIDRSGPCYTVDTIEILRDKWGADVEMYFIMGSDSLLDILDWHDPERLIKLCRFAVVSRPGYQVDLDKLDALLPGVASRVQMLNAPELAISSTDIRRRVREGLSIKYQVPEAVENYIDQHKLYQN